MGGAWTESAVTWANQPATTGTPATTSSGNGWREWTVKGQVSAMLAAGGGHGFLVRDASENNDHEQQFRSRENGSNRPQLVITWAAPGGGGGGGGGGTPAPSCTTVTVDASADTWVDQSSPSQTKGTDSALMVRSKSGQNVRTLVGVPDAHRAGRMRRRLGHPADQRRVGGLRPHAPGVCRGSGLGRGLGVVGQPARDVGLAGDDELGHGVAGVGRGRRSSARCTRAGGGSGFLVRDATEGANAEQSFHSRESGSDLAPELVVRFAPAP